MNVAFIIFVITFVLRLSNADALVFREFFYDSISRSIKNNIRQLFHPPANANDSIQYLLYTRSNPKEACFIEPTPEEIDPCPFHPNLETKILIHGYLVTMESELQLIKDALLEQDCYNVIYVDWSRYNGHPYPLAVANTIPVGKKVAEFLKFIKNYTGASSFHIIGFSLGAHIAGIVGKIFDNLERITGLDPSELGYNQDNEENQLQHTDAQFVDVIHSSDEKTGKGIGNSEPIGHMDFYPNGGHEQPACGWAKDSGRSPNIIKDTFDTIACSHYMALKFFLHSILDCVYKSIKCEEYERLPECSSEGNPTARMGLFAKRMEGLPVKSKFYLNTSANEPFC